jgi:hypothetical protein
LVFISKGVIFAKTKEFMYKPNVWLITPTCGRMAMLRRAVACFLDQDYEGEHTMLIFNNSDQTYALGDWRLDLPDNKHIILINQPVNSKTGKPYSSLGEIQNDILNFVPSEVEVINGYDDDDLILPDHISKGIEGLERCGKLAYKPKFSWFLHAGGCDLMENTMEPSIFIESNFLKGTGYTEGKSTQHHLKWVHALMTIEQICSDPKGKPTLLYTWGIDPIFKTSGAGETDGNFSNYRKSSVDHGNRIITPVARETYQDLLKLAHDSTKKSGDSPP